MKKKPLQLIVIAYTLLTLATPAYAYIDPVSVTFILQGIVGAVAAVLAGFRNVRTKVVNFFKGLFGSSKNGQ